MTLKQLIHIAPFSPDKKKDIIARINTLTPDEERLITEEAIEAISANYQIDLDMAEEEAILKAEEDKKLSTADIIESSRNAADTAFQHALETAQANEQIEEVRQTIQQNTNASN
ncbi:hypothetical protein HY469_01775 [Candidatus Roizmanbacteria bacterium]|nr:hypothetical protein [Candidatus Roizmanbacteria bacterium]